MNHPKLFAAAFRTAALIAITPSMAAPANDNLANAVAISTPSGNSASVNTNFATAEPGEPAHAGITGGHSIWYRFTPAAKDRFTFTTNGSGFDTTLAAYTGTAVNALTELASNDDMESGNPISRVEVTAGPTLPVLLAVDGFDGASGQATLGWNPAPLTNDQFAAAALLSGNFGSENGFNFRATSEVGEPRPGNSVWYRWTAPGGSMATISVLSSDMSPFIGIYTGTAVGALTEVATATGPGAEASVSFTAVAGTVYRIQVRGAASAGGEFALTWGVTGGTLLPDVVSLADTSRNFMHGWYLDQTQIPGRTLMRVTTATANIGSGPLELRGSSANPAVYQRTYKQDGTFTDQFAGTFTFHASHSHLHFDDWLQFHLRAVTAGNGVGEIVASGDKTSFAIFDLQSHDLSLQGAPSTSVYTGGLVQGISVGWRDVYGAELPDQWIDVTSVPPGTYWLETVADPDNRVMESDETNNVTRILVTYAGAPPPNNNFSSATVLTGVTAATAGRNFSATRETNEPPHGGNSGGTSVWYRWTAPVSAPVVISTEGSTFDTLLGVYTGTALNGLTVIASNDNDGALTTSRASFNAGAGTTYRIAVDGKNGLTGIVELAINPAQNDHFSAALPLTEGSGAVGGSTRRSTAQAGEPAHAGSPASKSIWYFWTATMTGDAVFSTEGSLFNARLGIYTGGALNDLTPVASAVSNGINNPATTLFPVQSGTGYLIAVDSPEGLVKLNWQVAAAIPPYVITHPASSNAPQGANLDIPALIGGSPLLSYQWKFGNNPLSDGDKYAGANSPVLTVKKLDFSDSGAYTLTATNPSGTVTTNAANLIVLTNPRTVTVTDSPGDIGGSVFAPVLFNASGNEHALQFTLLFNPSVLSSPQVTAGPDAAGGAISLDRSMEATGKLGVTLTLPGSNLFTAGLKHVLTPRLNVAAGAGPNTNTVLAFGDTPVPMAARSSTAAVLPAVFDAGNITLQPVEAGITSTPAPGDTFTFTVRGLRGKTYQLLHSADLVTWNVVDQAEIGPAGTVNFTPPSAPGPAFFKAVPAP